jgi:large subunit ribosomal protein L21
MIAVIKIAGQQYKVEKDQTLYVPHVEGNAGDKVALEVLMVDADGKLTAGSDVKSTVDAEIQTKKKKRVSQKERSSYSVYKNQDHKH